MARRLRISVHIVDGGELHTFRPGEDVPEWAQRAITNPDVWVDPPASAGPSGPPPRAGRGSGRDEWAAYAASLGVDVDDDASRDEIIAAVDAAQE